VRKVEINQITQGSVSNPREKKKVDGEGKEFHDIIAVLCTNLQGADTKTMPPSFYIVSQMLDEMHTGRPAAELYSGSPEIMEQSINQFVLENPKADMVQFINALRNQGGLNIKEGRVEGLAQDDVLFYNIDRTSKIGQTASKMPEAALTEETKGTDQQQEEQTLGQVPGQLENQIIDQTLKQTGVQTAQGEQIRQTEQTEQTEHTEQALQTEQVEHTEQALQTEQIEHTDQALQTMQTVQGTQTKQSESPPANETAKAVYRPANHITSLGIYEVPGKVTDLTEGILQTNPGVLSDDSPNPGKSPDQLPSAVFELKPDQAKPEPGRTALEQLILKVENLKAEASVKSQGLGEGAKHPAQEMPQTVSQQEPSGENKLRTDLYGRHFNIGEAGYRIETAGGDGMDAAPVFSSKDIVEIVTERFRALRLPEITEIRVRLKPEELGELLVKVTLEKGEIKGSIIAEKRETFVMLQENLENIKGQLQNNNINLSSINAFIDGDEGSHNPSRQFNRQNKENKESFQKVMDELNLTLEKGVSVIA